MKLIVREAEGRRMFDWESLSARAVGWPLPVTSARSRESIPVAGAAFMQAVLDITANAVDGDVLQIRRTGDGPAFARSTHLGAAGG